jgi:nitroreductase
MSTMSSMQAATDAPVHDFIAKRWSPYAFSDKRVSAADLRSLFEAARWAPSSYNEQPWRYIVATADKPKEFERLLSCLVEGNQAWARQAPVLALGVFSHTLERTGKPNAAAQHDLGQASAYLTFEATARGLVVHQMIGIQPDKAREAYAIPADFSALTGLAIGYAGKPDRLPEALRDRDAKRKPRKPASAIVFCGAWDKPYDFGR